MKNLRSFQLVNLGNNLIPDPATVTAGESVAWLMTHRNAKINWADYLERMSDTALALLGERILADCSFPDFDTAPKIQPPKPLREMCYGELLAWQKFLSQPDENYK